MKALYQLHKKLSSRCQTKIDRHVKYKKPNILSSCSLHKMKQNHLKAGFFTKRSFMRGPQRAFNDFGLLRVTSPTLLSTPLFSTLTNSRFGRLVDRSLTVVGKFPQRLTCRNNDEETRSAIFKFFLKQN